MQRLLFVIAVVMLIANCTLAGSVITSNLLANVAAIVNIDAEQDGAANYVGGQDNWFHPNKSKDKSKR